MSLGRGVLDVGAHAVKPLGVSARQREQSQKKHASRVSWVTTPRAAVSDNDITVSCNSEGPGGMLRAADAERYRHRLFVVFPCMKFLKHAHTQVSSRQR